jgi:Ca2+-binding RTX toxin-like protein
MTKIVETISGLRSEISNISSNGQDDDLILELGFGSPFTPTVGDFVTGSDGHETLFVINIDDGDDLTIQGGGATLDAGGYGRLFEIQNGQVKLHNMTLTNGHLAGDGGNASDSSGGGNGESALGAGLRNGSDDGVTLLDVDFINNKATGGGGASEDAGGGGGAGAPGVSGGDGGESVEGQDDGEDATTSAGGDGAPIGDEGGEGGTSSGGLGGAGTNYDGGVGGTAEDAMFTPVIGGGGGGAPIDSQSHHGGAGGNAAGAIFNDTGAQLTVIGSTFQSNFAAGGGGAGSNNGYDGGAGGSAAGAIWNDGNLSLGFRGEYSIVNDVNDGVGGGGGQTNTTSDGTNGAPGGSGKILGSIPPMLVESVTSIDSTASNGTFTAGDTIDIDVTFTNPVTLTDGSLNLMLDTGATVSIGPFGPSLTATGTYTVSSGETSGDLSVVGMAVDAGSVFKNNAADPSRDVIPIPPSHNNLEDNKDLVIDGGSVEETPPPPPPPPPGPTARGDTIKVVAGAVTGDLTQTLLSNDSNTNRIGGINNSATTGRVLTDATEGGIRYEASGFGSLAAGEEGSDSFRYTALNSNGSDSARVTVRVEGLNEAPTATDLNVSGGENETLRVNLDDAVSDPDNGDDPVLSGVSDVRVEGLDTAAPEGGWMQIDGNDLVFTPGDALDPLAEGDSATVAMDYTVADASAARDTGTLTIDVTGVNDAPLVPAENTVSTGADTPLTLELADFATDPDRGDTLSLETLDVASMTGLDATLFDPASLSFDADGATLESNPALEALGAEARGVLTLSYVVRDNSGAAAEGTLDVEILGVNDAPVAEDDSRTVSVGEIAASGDVLANDSDPDAEATLEVVAINGDETAVGRAVTLESGASLRVNADGGYVYQPGDFAETLAPGGEAVERVTYTLADEAGATTQASLAVTVTAPAEEPPEPDEPRQPAGGRDGDFISGGAGADVVEGGPLGDELQGGAGRDTVLANAEEDLDKSTGRDLLNGGSGPDKLIGDAGDDDLFGGADPDALLGGGGNDNLDGGEGNDILFGEAGDDRLSGGRGEDFLQGGPGSDTFIVGAGQGLVAIGDFTPGTDVLDVSDYTGTLDFAVIQEAAAQEGFATEIDLGGTMIRLLNIQVSTLDAEDFIFG